VFRNPRNRLMRPSVSPVTCIAAWRRFAADESAATAIEYSMVAALISLAIVGAVKGTGQSINSLLDFVGTTLASMSK
jgi:pilus assembly protein Flp/PilA